MYPQGNTRTKCKNMRAPVYCYARERDQSGCGIPSLFTCNPNSDSSSAHFMAYFVCTYANISNTAKIRDRTACCKNGSKIPKQSWHKKANMPSPPPPPKKKSYVGRNQAQSRNGKVAEFTCTVDIYIIMPSWRTSKMMARQKESENREYK